MVSDGFNRNSASGVSLADNADEQLLYAAKANSMEMTKAALAQDGNPNFQDEDGMTALHHAAAHGSRTALRLLVASGKCDYLIPDHRGRYPSDLAIAWSRDFAVARLLTRKRLNQAHVLGVSPRP